MSGNCTFTGQTGGVLYIRGFKGSLVIDAMTGGTCDIYANGADITINANCDAPSVITIYGNARVTIVGAPTATINDYTKETQLDTLEASVGRALLTMDFWSDSLEELQLSDAVGDKTPPSVEVADLPGDATVVRAQVMFKFRMIENVHATLTNNLDGGTVADTSQVMQIAEPDNGEAFVDCINFVNGQFNIAAATREGGDVIIGSIDVATKVDQNRIYQFKWLQAMALEDHLQFNDIQMGIRIWYSV